MLQFKPFLDSLPAPLQKTVKFGWGRIPFPIRYGRDFSKTYKQLLKTQWLPKKEIQDLQEKKLRSIIKYAYQNVYFYHKIMHENEIHYSDIKEKKDLTKLPIITKDVVRKHYLNFSPKDQKAYGGGVNETSGSTGSPIGIRVSKTTSIYELANKFRYQQRHGYRPGMKMVVVRPTPSMLKGSSDITHEYLEHMNQLFLSPYVLSYEICDEYIKKIKKFNPSYIKGTPSSLYYLAKYIDENNENIERINGAFVSSETLYNTQRKMIESAFNTRVHDWYGQGEMIASSCQCEEGTYHNNAEMGIIEYIKDNEPVASGETGELILTTLVNKAMPLIRYKPWDSGIPLNEKCNCGCEQPITKKILGKTREFIRKKDGGAIHGEFFTRVIEEAKWIREMQVIQKKNYDITLLISTNRKPNEKEKEIIIKETQKTTGKDTTVSLEFVERIYPTKAGKRPFVLSELDTK